MGRGGDLLRRCCIASAARGHSNPRSACRRERNRSGIVRNHQFGNRCRPCTCGRSSAAARTSASWWARDPATGSYARVGPGRAFAVVHQTVAVKGELLAHGVVDAIPHNKFRSVLHAVVVLNAEALDVALQERRLGLDVGGGDGVHCGVGGHCVICLRGESGERHAPVSAAALSTTARASPHW